MEKIKEPLEEMFELQVLLMDEYHKREMIPNFPLDLDTRKGQKDLKGMGYNIIEELSETYGDLEVALSLLETNKLTEAQKMIEASNIELADVSHFLVEFLIFSNIDSHTIDTALKNSPGLFVYRDYRENGTLENLYSIAKHIVWAEEQLTNPRNSHTSYQVEHVPDIKNKGNNRLSRNSLTVQVSFIWAIVHNMMKALNLLKSRDWSVEEKKVNHIQFNEKIIEVVVAFICYMEFIGKTPDSLLASYKHKNAINHKRLKEGY